MFVQHMLAVTHDRTAWWRPSCRTACCSAAARRGDIRSGLIEDDLLEAVIGLAPNLFYGTGIPACILVLRAHGRQASRAAPGQGAVHQRRPRVTARAARRTTCEPEHIEKIVTAYRGVRRHPWLRSRRGTSRSCARTTDNLNIRRYVDNTPPPEPHDVRAHLHGGVPKAEVEAKAGAVRGVRHRPRPRCSPSATPTTTTSCPRDGRRPRSAFPRWPNLLRRGCARRSPSGGYGTASG